MSSDNEKCSIHNRDCGVYELCILHDDNCGPYARSNPAIKGLFKPNDFNEDTANHFRYLKIKDTKGYTEQTLIENRIGQTLSEDIQICAHHRYTKGVGWKQLKRCQHPLHEHMSIQKKATPSRTAREFNLALNIIDYVNKEYNKSIIVGSMMCYPHLKEKNKKNRDKACDEIDEMHEEIYVPPEVVFTEEEASASNQTALSIAACLEMSPVVPLKRKRVEDLSEYSKDKYKHKFVKLKRKEVLKKCLRNLLLQANRRNFFKVF